MASSGVGRCRPEEVEKCEVLEAERRWRVLSSGAEMPSPTRSFSAAGRERSRPWFSLGERFGRRKGVLLGVARSAMGLNAGGCDETERERLCRRAAVEAMIGADAGS